MFAVFSISVFTLAVVTLAMLPLHVTVAIVLACQKIFSNDDSVSLSVSGLSDLLIDTDLFHDDKTQLRASCSG